MKLYELLEVLDNNFEVKITLLKNDTITQTTTKELSYRFVRDEIVYLRQDFQEKQLIIKLKGE